MAQQMKVQDIETDRLKPWADNPRLNEHAVDAVARSIRTFGFNVPILCDQNLTIVAGHTRWKAASATLSTLPFGRFSEPRTFVSDRISRVAMLRNSKLTK
jgi:hypothetical protein